MTLLIFHPLVAFVLSLGGLILFGWVLLSTITRLTLISIMVLMPLAPLFMVRLLGIAIVLSGLAIVRGTDNIALRFTTAQRHAAWLSHYYNF